MGYRVAQVKGIMFLTGLSLVLGCAPVELYGESGEDALVSLTTPKGEGGSLPPPLDRSLLFDRATPRADFDLPDQTSVPPPLPIPDMAPPPAPDMAPPPVPDMAPPPPVDPMAPPESAEMLMLVNAFRATGGTCGGQALPPVGPLTWNPLLEAAAQGHAEDMANQNYFAHQSQDGRNPGDRISAAGYQWMTYGENIAAGQRSVQAAFDGWVSSPGHCENMLRGRFEDFGFGFAENPSAQYGRYWVQKFGTSR